MKSEMGVFLVLGLVVLWVSWHVFLAPIMDVLKVFSFLTLYACGDFSLNLLVGVLLVCFGASTVVVTSVS